MLDTTLPPIAAITPDAGETLDVFGAAMQVKLDGATGLFLAEHIVPPGYGVPLHVHEVEDEAFWMLDGTLTLLSADGETQAGPGSCIRLPHGVVHGFRNDTRAPVRLLVMCTPGPASLALFRALDRLTRAGEATPGAIAATAAANGVRFL